MSDEDCTASINHVAAAAGVLIYTYHVATRAIGEARNAHRSRVQSVTKTNTLHNRAILTMKISYGTQVHQTTSQIQHGEFNGDSGVSAIADLHIENRTREQTM